MRDAFRKRGHDAWSNDTLPTTADPKYHLQCDVFDVLNDGWDLAIFHPPCTYLTCSAEWAYKDPDYVRYPGVGYHQKVKPETLVGAARREARKQAVLFVRTLFHTDIRHIAIENPRGHLSQHMPSKPQIIQPYQFGDDASKATCIWRKNLPELVPTKYIEPRIVNGMKRWANQTDSGQNRCSPSEDRWSERSLTYQGIADAFAEQWG